MILRYTRYVFTSILRYTEYLHCIHKLLYNQLFTKMEARKTKHVLKKKSISSYLLGLSVYYSLPTEKNQEEVKNQENDQLTNSEKYIEKEIVKRIIVAKSALDEKKTERAEKALEKAIEIGEKADNLPVGLTCAYEMLASVAFQRGDVQKAENLIIRALKKFKSVRYTCADNIVISFAMKLARLYKEENKLEAAEIIFRKCLDAQEKKYYHGYKDEETAQLWINTLFWYGRLLFEKFRYQEAVKCFESCYHLSCHVKSIQVPQVMVILHNLSESAYFNGDREKALRHLLHAVMLGRLTNFSDLPIFYIRIGRIYIEKGEYHEAKLWCEGARQISKTLKNRMLEKEAEMTLKEVYAIIKSLRTNDQNS